MRSGSPLKAKLFPYLLQFNEAALPLVQSPALHSTPNTRSPEPLLFPIKPRNIKIWDLPKVLEKESHRQKITHTAHQTFQTTRFNRSIRDFLQLLKSDRSRVPIRKVALHREKVKAKPHTSKTSGQDQGNQPSLHIFNRNAEGVTSLRPRFKSRTAFKKSGGLQPLQLISFKGLSDPCIRVLNYSGLEGQSGVPADRRSCGVLKRDSPEIRVEAKTAMEERKEDEEVETPPEPPRHYRQRKAVKELTAKQTWKSGGLEGWSTTPPDFSPLSRM